MGYSVLAANRAFLLERDRQSFINGGIAERGSPSSGGNYGYGLAAGKMADAENQDFSRHRDAGKNGASDVP